MKNRVNEIDDRSYQVREVLRSTPSWLLRSGNVMISIFIILFLFISWLIKYPDIVIADISISTSNPPIGIYSKTNGKIFFYHKEGKLIEKNTILASIENTSNLDDVLLLSKKLDTLNIAEFIKYPLLNFNESWKLGDVHNSYVAFLKSIDNYKASIEDKPLFHEKNSFLRQLNRTKKLLLFQKDRNDNFKKELILAEKDLARTEGLYKKGVMSLLNLEESEKKLLNIQRAIKSSEIEIENTKIELLELQSTIKNTSISLNRENELLINHIYESYENLINKVKEWKLKYLIISPISGELNFADFWSNNQYIEKGVEVAIIVPNDKKSYIGNALMTINNSGKVEIGQKVIIKLDGFNFREFGNIIGSVENISSVPRNNFYKLKIKIPDTLITNYGVNLSFDQELVGKAEIITKDLSLLDRFFYQLKSVFKN